MVLVLCIGDFHIPHRATDIPPKFKTLLVPGKIHHILCPGNLCTKVTIPHHASSLCKGSREAKPGEGYCALQETYHFLKTVCTDLHITRGDFDEAGSKYPDEKVSTKSFTPEGITCIMADLLS